VLERVSGWRCSKAIVASGVINIGFIYCEMHRYTTATLCMISLASAELWSSTWNSTNSTACRNLPGDRSWPEPQDWLQLNASVDGRLIATVPLAARCHGALYDADTCRSIQAGWSDPEIQQVSVLLLPALFSNTTEVYKTQRPSRILTGSTTRAVLSLKTEDA
jgi:hypothetical protein